MTATAEHYILAIGFKNGYRHDRSWYSSSLQTRGVAIRVPNRLVTVRCMGLHAAVTKLRSLQNVTDDDRQTDLRQHIHERNVVQLKTKNRAPGLPTTCPVAIHLSSKFKVPINLLVSDSHAVQTTIMKTTTRTLTHTKLVFTRTGSWQFTRCIKNQQCRSRLPWTRGCKKGHKEVNVET